MLSKNFQVMNSAETDLKVFWIRADQRWMSLRRQPGFLLFSIVVIFLIAKKTEKKTVFRFYYQLIHACFWCMCMQACMYAHMNGRTFQKEIYVSLWRFATRNEHIFADENGRRLKALDLGYRSFSQRLLYPLLQDLIIPLKVFKFLQNSVNCHAMNV